MTEEIKGPYLLDPDQYPFTIEAMDYDDEAIWTQTVEKPEGLALVRIPGFGPGVVKQVRCSFADGRVVYSDVPGGDDDGG